MPEVRPFRALRYAGDRVDLSAVVAPPYDVIAGREEARRLRERDPRNVVRLILPEDHPGEPGSRYRAAREELERWLGDGVLAPDPRPAFYPYRQSFRFNGDGETSRVGFLGLLRLEPFGSRVMAHENTLAGPREDRYRLISEVRANLSPVFALFEDPGGAVRRALETAMGGHWAARARHGADVVDELWRLDDPQACAAIEAGLRDHPLVFADGHHRYESALRHLQEIEARGEDPGGAAWCLAFFAPVPQPGLAILPTHRVVHGLPAERLEGVERKLEPSFHLEPAGDRAHAEDVARWEREAPARPGVVMGFARRGEGTLWNLTLKPAAAAETLAHLPAALRDLDVTVLHEIALRRVLGISEEDLRRQANLRYLHEAAPALRELDGGAQAVFLLRPTPIEAVFKVAHAGLRMPQKSTYFFPKVSTGFVLHRHTRD